MTEKDLQHIGCETENLSEENSLWRWYVLIAILLGVFANDYVSNLKTNRENVDNSTSFFLDKEEDYIMSFDTTYLVGVKESQVTQIYQIFPFKYVPSAFAMFIIFCGLVQGVIGPLPVYFLRLFYDDAM